MNRLMKWWKAEAKVRKRDPIVPDAVVEKPVTVASVEAAPIPNNPEIKAAQEDLVQALLRLGRLSHDLHTGLTSLALTQVTGGHGK